MCPEDTFLHSGPMIDIRLSYDCCGEIVFTFFSQVPGCRVSIHVRDLKMVADIFGSCEGPANRDHVWKAINDPSKLTHGIRTSPPWMMTIAPSITRHQRRRRLVLSSLRNYNFPTVIQSIVVSCLWGARSALANMMDDPLYDPSLIGLLVTGFVGCPRNLRLADLQSGRKKPTYDDEDFSSH